MIAFDQQRPDYRVVHDNLGDMSQVTTGQIYQKGSCMLDPKHLVLMESTFVESGR